MGIQLFDNYEDDGQLSMFDLGEDIENLRPSEPKEMQEEMPGSGEQLPASGSAGIRIQNCSSCGKMLSVREEGGFYTAVCNVCRIKYRQKM